MQRAFWDICHIVEKPLKKISRALWCDIMIPQMSLRVQDFSLNKSFVFKKAE
jgi:hypothetical protein